jgi:hypothetical protein
MNFPAEGSWIRWTTPSTVKEGQVVWASYPSLVVRWMDGEEQVFPFTDGYWNDLPTMSCRIELIEKPRGAARIQADVAHDRMSVARAAASLGTTKKQIRSWLRSGRLHGEQVDGKWVHVDPTSIQNLRA